MQRRIWFTVALALLCLALPAALGAEGNQEQMNEPVTISVLTRWSDQSRQSVAFRERLQLFMEEHPHIVIEDLSVNNENSFQEKLRVLIASGDVPEIVQNYGGAGSRVYFENNVFIDLRPYLSSDPQWRDAFLPSMFDQWEYDDLTGVYGVPYEIFAISLFYNRDIFAELGLAPPQTVEELIDQAEVLLAAGYVPLATGVADNFRGDHLFTNLFVKRYGDAPVHALSQGTASFEDPQIIDILSLMQAMNRSGVLGENISAIDYATNNAMFGSGESAMHFDGSWFLSDPSLAGIDAGVVPFPSFEGAPEFRNHVVGGPGAGLSVAATDDPRRLEAAITLLRYLTSLEHFSYLRDATGGGVYPVDLPASDAIDRVTVEYLESYREAEAFVPGVASGIPLPQMVQVFRNAIQGMLAGALTPEQAARQMAAEHSLAQ